MKEEYPIPNANAGFGVGQESEKDGSARILKVKTEKNNAKTNLAIITLKSLVQIEG